MSDIDRVTTLAAGWALALAVLAFAWARTPLAGSGSAFLLWSIPAVILAALSWIWLRRTERPSLRVTAPQLLAGAAVWAALAVVLMTAVGDEWGLDGLILRNTPQRMAGVGLKWVPGLFGAFVSIGGLAAALETRYRILHPAGAADAAPPDAAPPDAAAGP